MTRYLIDGRGLQGGSSVRGIGTYLRGLLEGLAEAGVGGDITLLLGRGARVDSDIERLGVRQAAAAIPTLSRRLQPLADPFLVSRAVRRIRPTLYHGVEYGQPILAGMPVVITAHDLIPFVLPKQYPWMRRERLLGLRLLRRADHVLADSRSTAEDLTSIASVDPARITVIFPGVGSAFTPASTSDVSRVRERHGLNAQRRYLLAVGTFDPRKRIGLLTRVVNEVRRHHDVDCVIAGDQGNFAPVVEHAVDASGLAACTRVTGHVPQEELVALYTGASVLAFTSAYEGFGLPPLEAMACGTPAVVFDNSSLPEVGGAAAVVVRDGDALGMAGAIGELLSDPNERRRRADAGRAWAANFAWRRTAAETLTVYRALAT